MKRPQYKYHAARDDTDYDDVWHGTGHVGVDVWRLSAWYMRQWKPNSIVWCFFLSPSAIRHSCDRIVRIN